MILRQTCAFKNLSWLEWAYLIRDDWWQRNPLQNILEVKVEISVKNAASLAKCVVFGTT